MNHELDPAVHLDAIMQLQPGAQPPDLQSQANYRPRGSCPSSKSQNRYASYLPQSYTEDARTRSLINLKCG
jgi:hypothetical protein